MRNLATLVALTILPFTVYADDEVPEDIPEAKTWVT